MSKSNPIVVAKSDNKVKIALPTLCDYGSDEDEEVDETPRLKNLNPSKTESKTKAGLLSILPPPKSAQNPFANKKQTEVNSSVGMTRSKQPNIFADDLYNKAKKLKSNEIEEEPKQQSRAKYEKFGSYKEYENEEDPEPFADEEKEVENEEYDDYNERQKQKEEEPSEETIENEQAKLVTPAVFDQEALIKLCGAQGKKKGLDSIELLDVGVTDIIGNNRAELMKQITSDYRPPSNKDYFASSSRKTHHVTYLAKVAVERDQELKAQWAESKFNRQQARQKYGF